MKAWPHFLVGASLVFRSGPANGKRGLMEGEEKLVESGGDGGGAVRGEVGLGGLSSSAALPGRCGAEGRTARATAPKPTVPGWLLEEPVALLKRKRPASQSAVRSAQEEKDESASERPDLGREAEGAERPPPATAVRGWATRSAQALLRGRLCGAARQGAGWPQRRVG